MKSWFKYTNKEKTFTSHLEQQYTQFLTPSKGVNRNMALNTKSTYFNIFIYFSAEENANTQINKPSRRVYESSIVTLCKTVQNRANCKRSYNQPYIGRVNFKNSLVGNRMYFVELI